MVWIYNGARLLVSVGQARLMAGGAALASFTTFITPSQLYINVPLGGGSAGTVFCTANITGGTAPFTYLWTHQSGLVLTITNPISESTAFLYSSAVAGIQVSLYKFTVTYSLAAAAFNFVNIDTELLV